jgi:hypothetical protein
MAPLKMMVSLKKLGFSDQSVLMAKESRLPVQGYYFYSIEEATIKKYAVLKITYRKQGEFGRNPNPLNGIPMGFGSANMTVYYVFPPKKKIVYQIMADESDEINKLEFKRIGDRCSGGAPRIEDRKDGHLFQKAKLDTGLTFLYSPGWTLHDMSQYMCSHDMTHVICDDEDLQIGLRSKNFELNQMVDYTCTITRKKGGLQGTIFYWYL